jgi:hypothetical protein
METRAFWYIIESARRLPRLSAACLPGDAQPPRRLLAR